MSDLSNLYISQSYKGLINLADSTEGITSQSNYELQDGLGVGIGVSITGSSLLVQNEISSSTLAGIGNVETYSASVDLRLDELEATASDHDGRVEAIELYTSSLKEAFSVSGTNTQFLGNISVSGSITAYELFVTVESSSVILSSGSNQLGDDPSDVQVFSGSVYVPNLHYLAGNPVDTNTRINNKLDSSWTGSVFLPFSSSVASELANIVADALPSSWTGSVFLPFSGSVDYRLDALEAFSQSLVLDTASFQLWTGSVFNPYTQSVANELATQSAQIDTKLENSWTSSVYEPFSSSVSSEIISLQNDANTHATTGSNNFFGSQSIDGDVTISGSLTVSGSSTLIGNSQQTGNQEITGSINHLGDTTQSGSQFISGSLTLDGRLSVTTSASIDGGWHVTGSSYYSGSVKGNVHFDSSSTTLPSDFTHSIDCSLGNFFDFYLLNGENLILAENIYGGETITVRLNQPADPGGSGSYGSVVWDTGSIKFPFTSNPQTTQGDSAIDVLTLVSFDTGSLYGVLGKNYL